MKKLLFRLCLGILVSFPAVVVQAETLQAMALSEFSTENPTEFIEFQAFNDFVLGSTVDIKAGYIVKAKVVDVVSPKRLKRDAKFSIQPVSYFDFDDNEHPIKEEVTGKYSPKFELNKADVAKNAALMVGNHFVKGISLGYHALEGAVKNEEGNRLKSSIVSLYESTPLSLANNGEEIEIKPYDFFSFKFKHEKCDDDDCCYECDSESDSVTKPVTSAETVPKN